jgi:DNA polymerase-3 subunit delta'
VSGWVKEGRGRGAGSGGGGGDESGGDGIGHARLQMPLGQGEAFARWLGQARALRLPHGFLVEGARGSGKSTVIDWLAAALLCPSELDRDGPCGVCRTCTRIANRQHPDVHVLDLAQDEAERKELKKSFYEITVGQVRQAQELLARHAVEGRARVLVVEDADHLAEEGQNALLKTLEEPGVATFLLLEASRPEQLLPTVRSRVQRLRVLPLPADVLEREIFRRLPAAAARVPDAIALSGGSLGQALAACTERAVQLHHLVQAMLADVHRLRPVATARAVLQNVEERRHELDAAREFLWLLRAELRRRTSALAAVADGSYGASSAEPWTTWLELTLAAERDLDLLIPPEQVLTACLVQFVPA